MTNGAAPPTGWRVAVKEIGGRARDAARQLRGVQTLRGGMGRWIR